MRGAAQIVASICGSAHRLEAVRQLKSEVALRGVLGLCIDDPLCIFKFRSL